MKRLDYQILNHLHPHREDGCMKYDDLGWSVWIRDEKLCGMINEKFNLNITPQKNYDINKETAYNIWHNMGVELTGVFGCDYDVDILDAMVENG